MALSSVQEARAGLDKLISKMDTLESGFDKIAERSCKRDSIAYVVDLTKLPSIVLSSSRLTTQRRRRESLPSSCMSIMNSLIYSDR